MTNYIHQFILRFDVLFKILIYKPKTSKFQNNLYQFLEDRLIAKWILQSKWNNLKVYCHPGWTMLNVIMDNLFMQIIVTKLLFTHWYTFLFHLLIVINLQLATCTWGSTEIYRESSPAIQCLRACMTLTPLNTLTERSSFCISVHLFANILSPKMLF
jgi:hypothetical protein